MRPPADALPPPRAEAAPAVAAPAAATEPETEERPEDLSEAWNFANRSAPAPRYVRETDGGVIYGPNPVGFYSGVSVEGNQVPPQAPAATGTKPALLTWTGFERGKASSRVFFQLNAGAAHDLKQQGKTVVLRLKNTRIHGRNNRRPLDLRYFKTPVETVRVAQRGKDTVVTVALKRDATPAISTKPSGMGYLLLVLEFADASP